MKTKTLSERIAECRQDIIDAGLEPEHDIGFQIIEELQAENQALLAKVKELQENYDIILENHNHFLNKPIYAHCDKLEAKVKELEEWSGSELKVGDKFTRNDSDAVVEIQRVGNAGRPFVILSEEYTGFKRWDIDQFLINFKRAN